MSKIDVEVCNPKFKDENNIYYIYTLDKSKGNKLNEIIDKSLINNYVSNNEFGICVGHIKLLDTIEIIDTTNRIELDEIIECNYDNFYKIYKKLYVENQIDFSKYIRMISPSYDIFEVKVIPAMDRDKPVLLKVDGCLFSLPYDIFITLIVLVIECVDMKNVIHFELIPKLNEHTRCISMKIKMDKHAISKRKGLLSISLNPYLCISGTKRRF